ncbi:MAG: AAA family ATPase, partial [Planctomycetales bacterium]
PGYVGYEEGGQLTEKIRRRPYAVVLVDEIDKAHPDVFNMLLQVMEEGRLTDSFGRKVDFRNAIVIMTTNAGAEVIARGAEFGFPKPDEGDATYDSMKERVKEQIEKHFRPEFLNRVDDLKEIVGIELAKVRERLAERNLNLILTDEAKTFLIKKGSSVEYGARPLRRAIENYVEDPVAEELLKGEFADCDTLTVAVKQVGDAKHLTFEGSVSAVEDSELAAAASDAPNES